MTVLAPAAIEPANKPAVRIGLLQSALPFPEGTRWHGGISYRPLNGNIPSAAASTSFPCTTYPETIVTEDNGTVSWVPWGVHLGDECLAGSTDDDEEIQRATRRLEIQTEYLVSRTFWTGDVGSGTFASVSAPNRPLADLDSDDLTTTGAVGVVTAFSRGFKYLADTLGSARGMFHVEPALIPFLAFYGVVIREGFSLVTALGDHIVVAGSGYDGSAPDGSAAVAGRSWVYVTSLVRAAVSAVVTHTAMNRANNDIESRASRYAIAEWDLQAHGALEVCLPDPGPSCLEVPS